MPTIVITREYTDAEINSLPGGSTKITTDVGGNPILVTAYDAAGRAYAAKTISYPSATETVVGKWVSV